MIPRGATVAYELEVLCPQCKTPILVVDATVAGVLLDDFKHSCGYHGVVNWNSPLAIDPRHQSSVRPLRERISN
jgi:hypothetical protein